MAECCLQRPTQLRNCTSVAEVDRTCEQAWVYFQHAREHQQRSFDTPAVLLCKRLQVSTDLRRQCSNQCAHVQMRSQVHC